MAFITSTGRFLPGPPINNEQIEDVLGYVEGKPSRLKRRILKSNGITTRHYAINADHETTHQNEDLATAAARVCMESSPLEASDIGLLSCATSQGDMVLPGFGSMVQGQLGMESVELMTTHGICSCGAMAIKAAYNSVKVGDHKAALVVSLSLIHI